MKRDLLRSKLTSQLCQTMEGRGGGGVDALRSFRAILDDLIREHEGRRDEKHSKHRKHSIRARSRGHNSTGRGRPESRRRTEKRSERSSRLRGESSRENESKEEYTLESRAVEHFRRPTRSVSRSASSRKNHEESPKTRKSSRSRSSSSQRAVSRSSSSGNLDDSPRSSRSKTHRDPPRRRYQSVPRPKSKSRKSSNCSVQDKNRSTSVSHRQRKESQRESKRNLGSPRKGRPPIVPTKMDEPNRQCSVPPEWGDTFSSSSSSTNFLSQEDTFSSTHDHSQSESYNDEDRSVYSVKSEALPRSASAARSGMSRRRSISAGSADKARTLWSSPKRTEDSESGSKAFPEIRMHFLDELGLEHSSRNFDRTPWDDRTF